ADTLCTKMRATLEDGSLRVKTSKTVWYRPEYDNGGASKLVKRLFNVTSDIFENPKSIYLLIDLLKIINHKDAIILDFFSGSATTAHAVMQLNAEDGGKRKFIMVQLPEVCAENSEAYKAGYKNVCEIGKERIRRAGKKNKEENPLTTQDLDIGFRVLKCDSSNMEDVYFTPKEYMDKQQSLFVDNIKKDRNDEDLLFDAMLKLDTPLSSKIERVTIADKTVYNVAQGHLMACFDKNVTDEVITAIAKEMPSYFVMRDSSQADDSVAINFEQIFNTYSPQTVRRVL
ncbi:DNA methyltransferase, partial [Phascolarctobacterium succinatutens]